MGAIGSGRGSVALQASPPCDGAFAWACSSPSSVFRLFFFYSPPPSPSALAFLLVSQPLRKQTKKDFVGKVLSIHSAERFLDIDYPVLYTIHTHSFSASRNKQQTTSHNTRSKHFKTPSVSSQISSSCLIPLL